VEMTKREETIDRIERVLDLTHKDSLTITITRLTAERAVSMLKEQEPVEPVIHPETKYHRMYKECGACGAYLVNGARYCSRCGKEVKRDG